MGMEELQEETSLDSIGTIAAVLWTIARNLKDIATQNSSDHDNVIPCDVSSLYGRDDGGSDHHLYEQETLHIEISSLHLFSLSPHVPLISFGSLLSSAPRFTLFTCVCDPLLLVSLFVFLD